MVFRDEKEFELGKVEIVLKLTDQGAHEFVNDREFDHLVAVHEHYCAQEEGECRKGQVDEGQKIEEAPPRLLAKLSIRIGIDVHWGTINSHDNHPTLKFD